VSSIKIKREGTAFTVIDMQNFMLEEKGAAAFFGVWKQVKEKDTVKNLQKAIGKARNSGIPIIYVQTFVRPQVLPEVGIWKNFKQIDLSKTSPWELEIAEEIKPRPEDFIVTKYNTMDAFHNTDLEAILKGLKCDTLIITGIATNFCVETTVRSAMNRGYNVVVLSDCVATVSEEAQAFPITVIFPMLGEVTTVDKFEIAS
jgi:ureidoacrylate peracid hydrolase